MPRVNLTNEEISTILSYIVCNYATEDEPEYAEVEKVRERAIEKLTKAFQGGTK